MLWLPLIPVFTHRLRGVLQEISWLRKERERDKKEAAELLEVIHPTVGMASFEARYSPKSR